MNQISISADESLSLSLKWVADLWLHEIDQAALETLQKSDIRVAFESLGGFIPNLHDRQTIETLAVEYCQLLVGPHGHVSPIQSVWDENKYQGFACDSMKEFFKSLDGYQPPSNMLDHIGVQLDFVAALLASQGNSELRQNVLDRFVKLHLNWTQCFFDQAMQTTKSDFYLGLIAITNNLLTTIRSDV